MERCGEESGMASPSRSKYSSLEMNNPGLERLKYTPLHFSDTRIFLDTSGLIAQVGTVAHSSGW